MVGFQQRDGLVAHDVGYRYRSASADTSLTVQQHGGTFFPGILNEFEGLLEVLLDVLVWRITGWDLFVLQTCFELAGCWLLAGNVQYAVRSDGRRVDGVPSVAEQ